MAQRAAKRYLAHRHKAASVIQQAVKKFLLLGRQRRVQQGILKAQVQQSGEFDESDDFCTLKGWVTVFKYIFKHYSGDHMNIVLPM